METSGGSRRGHLHRLDGSTLHRRKPIGLDTRQEKNRVSLAFRHMLHNVAHHYEGGGTKTERRGTPPQQEGDVLRKNVRPRRTRAIVL